MSSFRPHAVLTNGQQVGRMSAAFPRFAVRMSRNLVEWRGEITPFGCSKTYLISITFSLQRRVKVRVVEPVLQSLPGKKIPHRFRDGSLCLNLPEEWNSSMPVAEILIPWISDWIYYYEIWLATGDWIGGGHEPCVGRED